VNEAVALAGQAVNRLDMTMLLEENDDLSIGGRVGDVVHKQSIDIREFFAIFEITLVLNLGFLFFFAFPIGVRFGLVFLWWR